MAAKTNKWQVDLIGGAVTLAIAAIIAVVYVGGGLNSMRLLYGVESTLKQQRGEMQEVADVVTEANATLDDLQERLVDLERQLPAQMDFQGFYSDLSDSANLHHVSLAQVLPGDAVPQEDYRQMPVSIEAVARFDDFHAFLFDVQQLPRLKKVQDISIETSAEPNMCNIELRLMLYAAEG